MSNSYYEKGANHYDHHKELHIDTVNGGDIGKLLSAFFKDDAEEAEVVEEVKEVAGECDDLLVNDVFSDELFMTNQQLLKLRTIINESIGLGNQDKIDLSKGLEWYWLYQAIYDAGLFETRSNRENVVTVVGFVRQIAKWLPDIIDIDDEERI